MKNQKIVFNGKEFDCSHLSPFDCGSADSYYQRGAKPHYYVQGEGRKEQLTEEQKEAYFAGYEHNEREGGKKQYE